MSKYKKAYTLRVDETTLDKIKVVSDKNKRSINSQIEYLLEKCVEEFEKENGAIEVEENE